MYTVYTNCKQKLYGAETGKKEKLVRVKNFIKEAAYCFEIRYSQPKQLLQVSR